MAGNSSNMSPNASLYVGDLAPEVTEPLLFEIFNAVGPVASIRVCRDAITRRSLGYAYVNFHTMDDAQRALDAMNFTNIRGRPCRIMWSQRDPQLRRSGKGNIFVKNLDETIDDKTLFDTFSIFGSILSCKVARNAKGESRGYGFVHYEDEQAAGKAIEKVNGMKVGNTVVEVQPFKPKKARDEDSFTNVYVKNLPNNCTREMLDDMFAEFGEISSSVVMTDDKGNSRGFGFVNFTTSDSARNAVEAMNDKVLVEGETPLFVGRAKTKEERLRERQERSRHHTNPGLNLYIKNLDDTVNDKLLLEEFSKFGTISSARVMTDSNGRSRGFGFVCYSTAEEATKAVTEMSNKIVWGRKPLYVGLAQTKEERRANLEAFQRAKQAQMPQQMFAQPGVYGYPMGGGRGQMMFPGFPGRPQMGGARWPGAMPMAPGPGVRTIPGPAPSYPMASGPVAAMHPQSQQQQPQQPQQPAQHQPAQMRGQVHPQQQQQPQAMQVPQQVAPHAGLDASKLAQMSDAEQKNMIGEQLYTRISASNPELAGKITGMLLEMDTTELLNLLESDKSLSEKVDEAIDVLDKQKAADAATAQQEGAGEAN